MKGKNFDIDTNKRILEIFNDDDVFDTQEKIKLVIDEEWFEENIEEALTVIEEEK